MIKYQLHCEQDHAFDAWFRDSAAFDTQRKRGMVACPRCGSDKVEKSLMAPAIPSRRRREKKAQVFNADPREAKLRSMLRELREHVVSNADYVGDQFAQEARRIHHGEAESRGIYGEAAPDEARDLIDEGIVVHPLPNLPEDQN